MSRKLPRALGSLFVLAASLMCAASASAVTYNYVNLDHRRQHTHPNIPTITTLNPDLPDPSAGPIGVTDPSAGFMNAMTNSVASNDWWGSSITTFNWTGQLSGVFFFDIYRADAFDGFGRAKMLARYERGPGDPAANELFWIQTVDTSARGNNVPANEVIPYADVYASSYPNGAKLPFYFRPDETNLDGFYTGGVDQVGIGTPPIRSGNFNYNGTNRAYDIAFTDWPSRDIGNYWRGELFLATYDAAAKFVKVYDGFKWGFDVVPEPSALLIVCGPLALLLLRRSRDGHERDPVLN